MPYYDIILRTVYNNYHRYENIIYNIIGMNIEKIFQYKNDDDNIIATFTKMTSDNDLRLKDSEIGLIAEAFNLYAETKNRWLQGLPI